MGAGAAGVLKEEDDDAAMAVLPLLLLARVVPLRLDGGQDPRPKPFSMRTRRTVGSETKGAAATVSRSSSGRSDTGLVGLSFFTVVNEIGNLGRRVRWQLRKDPNQRKPKQSESNLSFGRVRSFVPILLLLTTTSHFFLLLLLLLVQVRQQQQPAFGLLSCRVDGPKQP